MKKWHKIVACLAVVLVGFLAAGLFFKRHMQSVTCGNFMSSYCFAATQWADDHEGYLPENLIFLSEHGSPKWLICPGDRSRSPALDWSSFTSTNSSYEIVTPKVRFSNTNTAFLRCKIHGHLGYSYGYVFDGVERRTKKNW